MKIYAHRGFSYKFPEASRIAYQQAIDVGADGLECDIRLTKDQVLICFHDRDTERISGVKKIVSRSTFAELKKLVDPMTLKELITLASESGKSLLIETKHPVRGGGRVEREVLKEVRKCSSTSRITLMSFSLLATLRFKREYQDVAYVISRSWRTLYLPSKAVAVDFELFRRSKLVRKRLAGYEIFLWTVNDPAEIPKIKDWNISAVITDRPDLSF